MGRHVNILADNQQIEYTNIKGLHQAAVTATNNFRIAEANFKTIENQLHVLSLLSQQQMLSVHVQLAQVDANSRLGSLEALAINQFSKTVKDLGDVVRHLSENEYCTLGKEKAVCVKSLHLIKYQSGEITFSGESGELTLSSLYFSLCFPRKGKTLTISNQIVRLESSKDKSILANHQVAMPFSCLRSPGNYQTLKNYNIQPPPPSPFCSSTSLILLD